MFFLPVRLLFHPAGRLLLGLIAAVAIALQAGRTSTLILGALVIAAAAILQAIPWAMAELRFETDFGRARWSRLMGDAEAALESGDLDVAGAKLEAALGDARRFPRPALAAESAERLADLMIRSDRRPEAERWLAESLRQRERVPGRDAPVTRTTRDRLADLRIDLGDLAGAEQLLTLQVESAGRAERQDAAVVAAAECRLARVLAATGRDTEAEGRCREALDRLERANGAHHWSLGEPLLGLAEIARRAGRADEAERKLGRALENAGMAGQTDIANRAREALLELYTAAGRDDEAVPLSEVLVRAPDAGAAGQRSQAVALMTRHADLLDRVGRTEEAGRYRRRADLLRAAQERSGR